MPGHKIDRITGDMQRELADIIRGMKDPRVTGLLSVVKVKVSGDLSYATVFISAMEGLEAAKESVKGLKHASGFVRKELGSRLRLRKVPELRFVADDSIAYSADITERLRKLNASPDESGEAKKEDEDQG